jgi:hypothetical protein
LDCGAVLWPGVERTGTALSVAGLTVADDDVGMKVHRVDPSGPLIVDGQGVVDLIEGAWGHDADPLVIPVERLAPDFFVLSTGLAGEVLQKLVS